MRDILLWPVASRILGVKYVGTVILKNGFKMKANMDDILNRFLIFLGPHIRYIWEPTTMKFLEILARDRKSIIVAGSHIGLTVLHAAKRTNGHVYAFEPVKSLYARSKENFELNPNESNKITLENVAIGNSEGVVTMYVENIRSSIIPYSKNHISSRTEQISMVTIDSYASKNNINGFDLIFLDIEGYELFALLGAENLIKQKPDLILEVSPRVLSMTKDTQESLYKFLNSNGYEIYIIIDNYDAKLTRKEPRVELLPLSSKKADSFKNTDYFNIFATSKPASFVQTIATILN